MPLEEIKVKLTADKTNVDEAFKDIKGTANKVEAESKRAATSIGGVISAVVGAAAVSKITSFFSAAIASYNKLETAMMRVESTSKALGQSIERNKKQVNELADQGFLSLTESANAFSDALLLGLDPSKAKKFVESLSDIAAVERTMGTLNEAVSSGIAGLRSGSSERVENIGVSVKKLSQEYQINTQKLGANAAVEKFYQGVLKESNKYRGEAIKTVETLAGAQTKYTAAVEKAQAAIGKGLEPVMKRLYAVGTQLATMFSTWFDGLKDSQKIIVLLGGAAVALVPAITAVGGALGMLALNPVTLGIMAVVAAVTALTFVLVGMEREMSRGVGLVDEQKKLKDLVEELKKTKAGSEELAEAQRKLDQVTKTLNESFGETLKILRAENAEYEKKVELVARLEAAEKGLGGKERVGGLSDDELAAEIAKYSKRAGGATSGVDLGGRVVGGSDAFSRASAAATGGRVGDVTFGGDGELMVADSTASAGFTLAVLEAEKRRRAKGGKKEPASPAGTGPKRTETRFLESKKALEEIAANEAFTIAKAKRESSGDEQTRRIAMAKENAKLLAETEIGQLRQVYAEWIEDKYQADLEGLQNGEREAIASVRRRVEAGKLKEKEAAEQIQKIREKGVQKEAALRAKSYAETMQAADATARGLAQIRNGNTGAGIGSALQGISSFDKESSTFQMIGSAGIAISAFTSISSTIGDWFGKSDAERAKEADEQRKRDEEAKAILALQADYQKSMLALQEAQAQLPFQDLARKLRLIDIQAQQETLSGRAPEDVEASRRSAKLAAIQSTISEKSLSIGEGKLFSGVDATPESLISVLNESASLKIQTAPLVDLSQRLRDAIYNGTGGQVNAIQDMIWAELNRLGYSEAGWVATNTGKRGNYGDRLYAAIRGDTAVNGAELSNLDKLIGMIISSGGSNISELNTDIATTENLLSYLEQATQLQIDIAANTKKTADNTTKLTEGKGDAIVDIAAGGLSQNGSFLGGGLLKYLMGKTQIDTSAMMLNPSMQNVLLSTQVMESIDERMARGIDRLVTLNEQEVDLLSIIAANLGGNATPEREALRQQILDILEEFRSRS